MYHGYLEVGGNEVINTARALGYVQTSECTAKWLVERDCGGLQAALEDIEYDVANVSEAPWYDDSDETTARFLGVAGVDFENISNSMRTASVQENVEDGGVVGRVRHTSRAVRVTAVLTAIGEDALEFGMSWLKAALDPEACGSHGNSCGATDLCFFVACPTSPADQDPLLWQAEVTNLLRRMHGVVCTSGPLILEKMKRGNTWGYLVEFTLTAGTPWVFSDTREVPLPPVTPLVIQDIPFNLVPYPSAELGAGSIIVARNYASNPSVEANATSYAALQSTVSGGSPSSYFTSGRVNDIAADGTWSFRGRILGNGSTAASGRANMDVYHQVTLSGLATKTRCSFTVWGAAIQVTGVVNSIQSLSARAEFYNASNTLLSTTQLGTAPSNSLGGYVFSAKSVQVPSSASYVRVIVRAVTDWESSATPANNSDIRVYIDAVGVTVP